MTEFWKSNERYFCEICKCWMDGKARARRTHEEGKSHKENYIAHQKALREKKAAESAAEKTAAKQWADLDEAATKAYEQDLIAQGKMPPPRAGASAAAAAPAAAVPVTHHPPPPSLPPAVAAPPPVSAWQATLDPSTGATYYYNIHTLATSWTVPEELAPGGKQEGAKKEDKGAAGGAMTKKERKAQNHAAAAAERGKTGGEKSEGAEDRKDGAVEPSSKKQKTESASAPAPAAAEIDEDTGLGRWETVVAAPAPTAAELAAASSKPRMTPFGMSTPAAPAAASEPAPAARWAGAHHAAGDDDDADDDGGGVGADAVALDVAEQIRRQFGPSALVRIRAPGYESGVSLLDEGNGAEATPAATASVSFKKKRDRSANVRKPVAATNH